jgi:hypothetical protein
MDFQSNTWETTGANSSYDALQMSLEKKVGSVRLLGAYTWSKSLDNSSGFYDQINPFNPKQRWLSTFDIAHNFVVSYSYDLPLARPGNGIGGKLLSGWSISGITRFTTGLPVTLSESDDASLCGCLGVDVPNYNGQPIHFFNPRKTGGLYFSTSPFSPEITGIPGNASRRFFHGPGINNWDMALHKTTAISEHSNLEFRAEFFNLFNYAQFTNPNGDVLGNFGVVGNTRPARIGQGALKFTF